MERSIQGSHKLPRQLLAALLADSKLAAGGAAVPLPRPIALPAQSSFRIPIPVPGAQGGRRGGTARKACVTPAIGPAGTPVPDVSVHPVRRGVAAGRVPMAAVARRPAIIAGPHRGGLLPARPIGGPPCLGNKVRSLLFSRRVLVVEAVVGSVRRGSESLFDVESPYTAARVSVSEHGGNKGRFPLPAQRLSRCDGRSVVAWLAKAGHRRRGLR